MSGKVLKAVGLVVLIGGLSVFLAGPVTLFGQAQAEQQTGVVQGITISCLPGEVVHMLGQLTFYGDPVTNTSFMLSCDSQNQTDEAKFPEGTLANGAEVSYLVGSVGQNGVQMDNLATFRISHSRFALKKLYPLLRLGHAKDEEAQDALILFY